MQNPAPVAADLSTNLTKPIDLSQKPACSMPVNYIHHRHLLSPSPKNTQNKYVSKSYIYMYIGLVYNVRALYVLVGYAENKRAFSKQ